MKVSFRAFDPTSTEDSTLLAKWQNDPTIRHFFNYWADPSAAKQMVTAEEIRNGWVHEIKATGFRRLMILVDDVAVGEMSMSIDGKQLLTKIPGTAWIGIVIGEATARGRGLGSIAMKHLEEIAHEEGAQRVELGVFEFNHPAINLYKKLGYVEFKKIPDFQFWDGRRWADIRMLKEIGK